VKTIKTPFLLKSVFFQLLDLLVWFKMYVDSNPKTGNWVKTVEVTEHMDVLIWGKVINLNPQKGFAFFKPDTLGENIFIPPHLVTNHALTEGLQIQVDVEEYTDNRTNKLKNRVKRIELSL
jgi:cold shock CspA family protein